MTDGAEGPVLVTGGAGFIGSHLVNDLTRRGVEVVVCDDLSAGRAPEFESTTGSAKLVTLDLRGDEIRPVLADHDFTAIFHLASHASVPASVEHPQRDLDFNVGTTLNLLVALRDVRSRAVLVNVSSAAVYGDGAGHPLREEEPKNPISPYGVSKLAAEHYVAVFARLFGVLASSARLFPVYGPGQSKQVIFDVIRKLHDDPEEIHVHGDGSEVRDFNHVANVVEALQIIVRRGAQMGEVYNVASGEPTSIAELVRTLCRAMELEPRVVFSGQLRPGDARSWMADISRLRGLGYRPPVRLVDGLNETVAWFRREVAGV